MLMIATKSPVIRVFANCEAANLIVKISYFIELVVSIMNTKFFRPVMDDGYHGRNLGS